MIKQLIKESFNKKIKIDFNSSFVSGDFKRASPGILKTLKNVLKDLDLTDYSDIDKKSIGEFLEGKYSKSLVIQINNQKAAIRLKNTILEISTDNQIEFERLLSN